MDPTGTIWVEKRPGPDSHGRRFRYFEDSSVVAVACLNEREEGRATTASAKSLSYLREQGWGHRIDDGANDRITPGRTVVGCDASSDPRRRHEFVRHADKTGPQMTSATPGA